MGVSSDRHCLPFEWKLEFVSFPTFSCFFVLEGGADDGFDCPPSFPIWKDSEINALNMRWDSGRSVFLPGAFRIKNFQSFQCMFLMYASLMQVLSWQIEISAKRIRIRISNTSMHALIDATLIRDETLQICISAKYVTLQEESSFPMYALTGRFNARVIC